MMATSKSQETQGQDPNQFDIIGFSDEELKAYKVAEVVFRKVRGLDEVFRRRLVAALVNEFGTCFDA